MLHASVLTLYEPLLVRFTSNLRMLLLTLHAPLLVRFTANFQLRAVCIGVV